MADHVAVTSFPTRRQLFSLRPLLLQRRVETWGPVPEHAWDVLNVATSARKYQIYTPGRSDDLIIMCLDSNEAESFLRKIDVSHLLRRGATAICWTSRSEITTALEAPYHARYVFDAGQGAVVSKAGSDRSTVLHLPDDEGVRGQLALHIWSERPIERLSAEPVQEPIDPQTDLPITEPSHENDPDVSVLNQGRDASLISRLLRVEDRTMELRSEILKLKEASSTDVGNTRSGYFDVPRIRHIWPLAETPVRPPATLKLYDRRSDDAVIVEAQRGVAFMEIFDLLGTTPDFSGAVENLANRPARLDIMNESPDVSIIIPVYGQLGYTLNCIDSLLNHKSRYSAEIIVIDDCSPDRDIGDFIEGVKNVRYHRQKVNGGFIKSCNTGGELAKGEFIIMLNSDTRVVDGWLDETISSFSVFPKAGLVGSKMLYPDGSLQEAGGILWRDGSAWNYGRDDDPNRPQYSYARQVDYISGCSVAMRRELWLTFGGFDPFFTPAYAEDVDLCTRVSQSGYEVWYQPLSRVVHYEGKTSGTSTGAGVKAYQVINLKKIFLRYRKVLELHRRNAEAPFFEKERRVTKRMLVVDAVTPTPNQDAGSVQTVLGLRCAQALGYKTHFVPEDNWLFEPGYTPALQREGTECFYAPFEVGFEAFIKRYGWLFDVVLVYRVGVMSKSLPILREYAPQAVILFHLADLHYLRMHRQAELDQDRAAVAAALLLKQTELEIVQSSDCTITHSTVEAEILAKEVPGAPVVVWPLMMELASTKVGWSDRQDICFLGGYRHSPNVDAVRFFASQVLPVIHETRPEIRFLVAGSHPPPEIIDLANDRIVVTGMIDDLSALFDNCRVFVCPLRVGAGAKGKVMSALSYGIPIISTSVGVEGAGLENGKHVIVEDNPREMARAILELYDNPYLWDRMSQEGQELISQKFSLRMGASKLEEAIDKALRRKLSLDAADKVLPVLELRPNTADASTPLAVQ